MLTQISPSIPALYITDHDLRRLRQVIDEDYWPDISMRPELEQLGAALARRVPVAAEQIPGDVITLNSQVGVFDLEQREAFICTLVLPQTADAAQNRISILAPIGLALLGHRVGDIFECQTPAGVRRLKVTMILYQPEAVGEYDLPEDRKSRRSRSGISEG